MSYLSPINYTFAMMKYGTPRLPYLSEIGHR